MAFCDSIKLEKGMYSVSGKGFTQVLEELDPSENYKGTPMENLDAYERQLKRFGIKVNGPGCDKVEKFFSATDSAILFPEFISRAIKKGLTACDILPSITAANTFIDGIDYRTISSTTENYDSSTMGGEGKLIRAVNVTTNDSLIKLKKYGRLFSSTYEALRFQNLDVVSIIFKQIGMDIACEMLEDAVTTLMPGTSESGSVENAATLGTLTYADLLKLWAKLSPYQPNVMIASAETVKDILSLSSMQDAQAGLAFHGTGHLVTPLGAKLVVSEKVDAQKILGIDKNFALQMIQSGGVTVEYDKVIEKQLEKAAVSMNVGFSKIFKGAVKVLNYKSNSQAG